MQIKSKKTIIMLFLNMLFLLFTICFFIYAFIQKDVIANKYEQAQVFLKQSDYNEAISLLESLQDYKDGAELYKIAQIEQEYSESIKLIQTGNYAQAIDKLRNINEYINNIDKNDIDKIYIDKINESIYNLAIIYYEENDLETSKKLFTELCGYKKSDLYLAQIDLKNIDRSKETIYIEAMNQFNTGSYENSLRLFETILDYSDSQFMVSECKNKLKEIKMHKLSTTILSGLHYSAALKNNNQIICTDDRYNFNGWDDIISISGFGPMIIGLNKDGTVRLEGYPDRFDIYGKDIWNVDISDWKDIIQIASGHQHVVGLKYDGTVVSKGLFTDPNWENINFIAAGWEHTVGIDSDNNIHIMGNISDELLQGINDSKGKWNNIISIDTGGGKANNIIGKGHIVGLREDGTVIAFGDNQYGQCNVYGSEWSDIIAISAGDWHTIGLKKDGTVVSTHPLNFESIPSISACNVYGSEWKDIIAISAGCGTTIGLKKDGSIVSTGYNKQNQLPMNGDINWRNIKIYDEWDSILNSSDK